MKLDVFLILEGVLCFHQGVIFEKEGDVLLTESYWTVVLQYNLTGTEEENRILSIGIVFPKSSLAKQQLHTTVHDLETSFRYEYYGLQQMVTDYVGKTSDLVTLLPRTQKKRDLKAMNSKIDDANIRNYEMYHDAKDQLTVLDNMHSGILNHSKVINKMIYILKSYHQVMHDNMAQNYRTESVFSSLFNTLFQYLKLSCALSEIKDAINLAVQRMTQLHQAVEDLAANRTTSNLLPPHQFLEVLKSVKQVIPALAKLFLDLRVLIKLSLKTDNQVYEVFNNVSCFNPSLKRWVKWEVDDQKLIVSKDRQTYTVYSSGHYRSECSFGPLTVCPLSEILFNVHQRQNCPIELLLKEKITLCTRKLISGLKSPVLIRSPTLWIYTTSGEAKVVLNCLVEDAGLNFSTTTLKGVGEFPNRDRCDLISDGYRMPVRFIGSSWHSSDFGKITFPEVDGIYSKEETDLLNQDVNDTLKVLQELDDQLGTLSVKEYSLESTFQHLRVNSFKHRIVKQVILSGSTITVLLIVIFICLRYRVRVANLLRASLRGSHRHPEATRTDAELGDLGKSIVLDEQTVRESNQPERECVPERSGIIA
ncbi:hypothetical protein J6590_072754 [Homalodisca vitripennis]|nr:hypothetical protein J6590_072754 [Homalodisca vitripennis]